MNAVIDNIVSSWPRVASVGHWVPSFNEGPELDFPLSLLPVAPEGLEALAESERAALALSLWIQYNRRAMDAEEFIANPAIDWLCKRHDLPTAMQLALLQAAVDERYHTYFHRLALEEALGRCFVDLPVCRSITVRELHARQAECTEDMQWQLVQLAYAAVAEVSVNAFLNVLAESPDVRASNRELVRMHSADESLHASIFLEVVTHLRELLDPDDAAFLVAEIRRVRDSFLKHDFSMFESVFDAHGIELEFENSSTMMTDEMDGADTLIEMVSRPLVRR